MVNGLNVILKLILDIYTTYEIVGNDVEAVGILSAVLEAWLPTPPMKLRLLTTTFTV